MGITAGISTGAGIAIAAGASAAGGIASGLIGANATENAAQTQYQSTQQALDFQKQVYGTEQQQVQPYLQSGVSNLNTLNSQMGNLTAPFDPTAQGLPAQFSYGAKDFQVDPGFNFALQQGQQAIQRSAASKAGVLSGAAEKELANYTTGMAEQGYGTAYNRAQQTYQQNYGNAFNTYESNQQNAYARLAQQAGQGLSATGMANQAGQSYAQAAGQYTVGAGNALAAGQVGSANALSSGISGSANSLASAMNNQALIAQLTQGSGYGGIGTPAPYGSDIYNAANAAEMQEGTLG